MERIPLIYLMTAVLCVNCLGQDALPYFVFEEIPPNSFVGDVVKDSNLRATTSEKDFAHILYSFLSQQKSYEDYFRIDAINGSIYTAAKIDRENITHCADVLVTTCVLQLSVVAKSKISAFYRSLKVTITVNDINDHAPKFPTDSITLHIPELATVGSKVPVEGAVDEDTGLFGIQKYYIKDAIVSRYPFTTTYKALVDGSSEVMLEITGDLDREKEDKYSLVIVAEDGGDPKLTGTISVHITIDDSNDNAPNFTQKSYRVVINETIDIGAEIIQLSAVDGDIGRNGEIEYRLSKNQNDKIKEMFAINATNGVLYVKQVFASGGQHRIIVEASDKGVQPLMTQIVVTVIVINSDNNPPQINANLFSDTDTASVSEYAEIGTVVAHVGIIDKDQGMNGITECSLDSGGDVLSLQPLQPNEFKVTVAKGLDRETTDLIYVKINCHDKGSPPLSSHVEFNVRIIDENDNTPKFLQETYVINIVENNAIDTDIVQVSAQDIDAGDNAKISYSVWAPGDYQFYMDPVTGFIKAMSVFDREDDESVILYAYAKDHGNPSLTSTAIITINVLDMNDNDPRFNASLYTFSVSENLPNGTIVGAIKTSDNDTGLNAMLGLIISHSVPFTVDASGVMRTTQRLDREEKSSYHFMMTVYDHGVPARNSTASVVVDVTDINDHTPQFVFPDAANYTVEVEVDTVPQTTVTQIVAFDLDEGLNGQLFYSIRGTNVSDLFSMDSNTGEITLARAISALDQDVFYMLLAVEDNGSPKKSATSSINIFVIRKHIGAEPTDKKGENLLIAIMLSSVTFVLVFTIVLVICILKRKGHANKEDNSDSDDGFCTLPRVEGGEKRVQFSDIAARSDESCVPSAPPPPYESLKTFSSEGSDSKDSDVTSSNADMETPILPEKTKSPVRNNTPNAIRLAQLHNISPSGSLDARHVTPRSEFQHSTPRSDYQINTLQTHSALLHTTVKPQPTFSTFVHEDNHSQTSAETTTTIDSGRGGSESDIHSTSLSQSHDSEMRPMDPRYARYPPHNTSANLIKPWLNLGDIQYQNCHKLPVAQQLHHDQKHRLQLRNLANRSTAKIQDKALQDKQFQRGLCTQSNSNFDRSKFVTFHEKPSFLAPPSDLDRSYMTYDEDDDDLSTTTSGSYTIDHEDVTLDMRSPGLKPAALRGCLV